MFNVRRHTFILPAAMRWAGRTLQTTWVPVLLLLTALSLGSPAATAQEFDTVYQLHSDGSITQNTCSGTSCGGSVLLDTNPSATSITSGGGGLFQMHSNGSIWQYTGTPCSSGCPGWMEMDNNGGTKTIAAGNGLGNANPYLFQLHFTGSIWQSTGTPCNGGSCLGWVEVDSNSATTQIIAAGGTLFLCFQTNCPPNIPPLVQLHNDGTIWQYTGTPCGNGCPGWQKLDVNPSTAKIFGFANGGGGSGAIFQWHNDGSIWEYTGTPCSGNSCPGWKFLNSAPSAKQIMTAETSGRLFVMNNDGSIWELTGSGWVERDNNAATIEIAASDNGLFQLHNDGTVWWLGGNGWVLVSNNPGTRRLAASSFLVLP